MALFFKRKTPDRMVIRDVQSEAVVRRILQMVVKKQTQASLADQIGVSGSFLNEVIRGSRPPTGKILDFLNLERHVIYTKKGEAK